MPQSGYDQWGNRRESRAAGQLLSTNMYNPNNGTLAKTTYGNGDFLSYDYDRYAFRKNLQGDVIAILDTNGDPVARYAYDAWGKVLSVTDKNGNAITDANHVANINPIRYRGYYYDTETGWYYLNSRYYDPSVKRFINADGVSLLGYAHQNMTQYNMFAYCFNNPVGYYDPTGDFPVALTLFSLASAVLLYIAAAEKAAIVNIAANEAAQQTFSGGYIDDQNTIDQFRMGRAGAAWNGCGWIAAYNAMIMLGDPQQPADVIQHFDNAWGSLALGALGTNPWAMKDYFTSKGYKVTKPDVGISEGSYDFYSQQATACIMLYIHESGMHYAAYKWTGNQYTAYNNGNNHFTSVNAYIKENGYTMCAVWCIS